MQQLMAEQGQMLPLDPPLPGRATVGGILATNASGPLRYQFGMPRDLALGAVVVYADGTVAKAGGRTVKNVAGYDMTRLHIGAFGTLGIIVEATFKVTPRPKSLVTVVWHIRHPGRGGSGGTGSAHGSHCALVAGACWAGSGGRVARQSYTVAVRLGGQPVVVGPQSQRALDTLKEAQQQPTSANWPALRRRSGRLCATGRRQRRAPAASWCGWVSHHPTYVTSWRQSLDVAARHGLTATTLAYPAPPRSTARWQAPTPRLLTLPMAWWPSSRSGTATWSIERSPQPPESAPARVGCNRR